MALLSISVAAFKYSRVSLGDICSGLRVLRRSRALACNDFAIRMCRLIVSAASTKDCVRSMTCFAVGCCTVCMFRLCLNVCLCSVQCSLDALCSKASYVGLVSRLVWARESDRKSMSPDTNVRRMVSQSYLALPAMPIKVSQIEHWALSRLKSYPNNAKLHPMAQVEAIASSITEFSFTDPIQADETGEILAGHGRFEAAKLKQLKTVPVIVVEGLSAEQKKAYRIAHNAIASQTGLDADKLEQELAALLAADYDLQLTGLSEETLNQLLSDIENGENLGEEDDSVGERLSNQSQYPLAIVLGFKDWQRWKTIKEKLGVKSDSEAMVLALNTLERQ